MMRIILVCDCYVLIALLIAATLNLIQTAILVSCLSRPPIRMPPVMNE